MRDQSNIRFLILGVFLGWVLNMVFRHYETVEDRMKLYEQGYEDGFSFGEKAKVQELIEWKKSNFNIKDIQIDSIDEY